jgi:hypothetical protein
MAQDRDPNHGRGGSYIVAPDGSRRLAARTVADPAALAPAERPQDDRDGPPMAPATDSPAEPATAPTAAPAATPAPRRRHPQTRED